MISIPSPSALATLCVSSVALAFALPPCSQAQVLYWDINSTSAGSSGGSTAPGTWGGDPFWNDIADGTGVTGPWQNGATAVFSAGTNATGAYTVSLSGTQTVGAISFNLGDVTLTGGTVQFDMLPFAVTVAAGALGTVNSQITSADGLTKNGGGTLHLGGNNTYSGATNVTAGTLAITDSGNLGGGPITANNGGALTVSSDLSDTLGRAVTIDGVGSAFTGDGYLWFNRAASTSTTIDITNGGTMSAATSISLADASSSIHTLDVTGPGSSVAAGTTIFLGYLGDSTINVGSGGTVTAATLDLANQSIGSATLNLNAGGVLALSGGSSAIVIGAGAINFNLSGGELKVLDNDLSTALPMTLAEATDSAINTNAFNATLSGVLSGLGALTKTGGGILSLSGNNTYFGGTTVDSGTLAVTDLANLGTGDIAVNAGANLSAPGNLDFSSDRNVTVSGAGATFSTPGYIWLSTGGSAATTSVTVANGGTFSSGLTLSLADEGSTSQTTLSVTGADSSVSATGNLYVGYAGQATATVASGGSIATDATLSIATTAGSTGTLNLNEGGTLRAGGTEGIAFGAGTGTFNFGGGTIQVINSNLTTPVPTTLIDSTTSTVDTNGFDAAFTGIFSGNGAIAKSGTGNLTLSVGSTHTGGTILHAGTLTMGDVDSLGATTSSVTLNGGTLDLGGFSPTTKAIFNGGTFTNGSLDNASAYEVQSGSLDLSLGGSANLTKTGSGTFTLTGANTYTGGTTIVGGTLVLGHGSALGSTTASLTLAGGILDLGGFSPTTGMVIFTGGTFTNGSLDNISAYEVQSGSLDTSLGGSAGFTKTGPGTFILTGANTYTGGTTISGGILQLGDGGNSGSVAGNISNNGTLVFNRSDDHIFNGVISGTGGVVNDGHILRFSAAQTYTGPTTINSGYLVLPSTVDQGLAASTTANPLTKEGLGTLALSGANTAGTFALNGGALDLASGASLTTSAWISLADVGGSSGSLTLSDATLDVGTVLYVGYAGIGSLTIGTDGLVNATRLRLADTAAGAATVTLNPGGTLQVGGADGIVNGSGTTALHFAGGTLQLNATDFTSHVPATLTGTTTFDTNGHNGGIYGSLSGTGGFTKIGAGVLTVTHSNPFSGAVTVDAGTLVVNTATDLGTGNGDVTINAGGALVAATHLEFVRNVTVTGANSVVGSSSYLEVGSAGDGDLTVAGGGAALLGNHHHPWLLRSGQRNGRCHRNGFHHIRPNRPAGRIRRHRHLGSGGWRHRQRTKPHPRFPDRQQRHPQSPYRRHASGRGNRWHHRRQRHHHLQPGRGHDPCRWRRPPRRAARTQ